MHTRPIVCGPESPVRLDCTHKCGGIQFMARAHGNVVIKN